MIELPEDCVVECSAPGPVDTAVRHWCEKLKFHVNRVDAINYLASTGGWQHNKLAREDDSTLAERILWVAACDLKEDSECTEWYFGH
jgi:hypothetical protein